MCPLAIRDHISDDAIEHQNESIEDAAVAPADRPLDIFTPVLADGVYQRHTDRAQLIQQIKAGDGPNRSVDRTDFHHRYPTEGSTENDHSRPKSALHSGVFTDDSLTENSGHPPTPVTRNFQTSFEDAFLTHSQATGRSVTPRPIAEVPNILPQLPDVAIPSPPRRVRGGSTTSLSNFVFKTPTSPLARSANTDRMETESTSSSSLGHVWAKYTQQRNTTSQSSFTPLQLSPSANIGSLHMRHQSLSYKRRSMPDSHLDNLSVRYSRRLSHSGGLGSELPFGSFVGSYEESILNGRMSTTPSKPLTFVAKIGVLGLGKCKPALRCPTHVTIPFPAYFYSVGDYDSPSPYVGQIDLETLAETSNKKFPHGGYRIPQQGQLQIVIKNPNKTAVKLFLVPYDLRDMEPGTKTFIRQKSFATGNAILDEILPATEDVKLRNRSRESLRYLIHLHICCPSRGRYYLYRNIRVVFANRVPDGKEKMRNEILLPDPKYSAWRSGKDSAPQCSSVGSVGRKRSQSLYGIDGDHVGTGPGRVSEKAPPIPAVPAQYLERHQSNGNVEGRSDRKVPFCPPLEIPGRSYDKIPASLYSSSGKLENHGLLARRLKGLDVEEQGSTE